MGYLPPAASDPTLCILTYKAAHSFATEREAMCYATNVT